MPDAYMRQTAQGFEVRLVQQFKPFVTVTTAQDANRLVTMLNGGKAPTSEAPASASASSRKSTRGRKKVSGPTAATASRKKTGTGKPGRPKGYSPKKAAEAARQAQAAQVGTVDGEEMETVNLDGEADDALSRQIAEALTT